MVVVYRQTPGTGYMMNPANGAPTVLICEHCLIFACVDSEGSL